MESDVKKLTLRMVNMSWYAGLSAICVSRFSRSDMLGRFYGCTRRGGSMLLAVQSKEGLGRLSPRRDDCDKRAPFRSIERSNYLIRLALESVQCLCAIPRKRSRDAEDCCD